MCVRRGRENDVPFRLSLFPCCSRQQVLPSRMCSACQESSHCRLPTCQQVVFEYHSFRRITDGSANRSTMAWGLEARVPFLDKAFLEVAMNVDAKEKMFAKDSNQVVDEDGCPKMEKVS